MPPPQLREMAGAVAMLSRWWRLIAAGRLPESRGQKRRRRSREAPRAKQPPAQITVENGQTLITLDAATQQRLGFTVATLTSTVTRAQAAFPAVVLSVQELATFRNTYVAAQAQLQKARIQAGVDGKEYERLKALSGRAERLGEVAAGGRGGACNRMRPTCAPPSSS